jgi:hypothetical protein
MNIKVISLESGQSKICDHKKLVKKLMEKGRITREMRDHLFENPYDLLRKLNLIRFNNSRYEES